MSRRSTRRTAAQQRSDRSAQIYSKLGRNSARHALYRRTLRLEPLEDRHLLAITVTTLADTVDFDDGLTSLREAIFAANTVPGADTIDFAPALTATGPATILLTNGELKISDSLTINGPGAEHLSIAAWAGTRILNVDDGLDEASEVRLAGLLFNGTDVRRVDGAVIFNRENLTLLECVVENGSTSSNGGGIYSSSGKVSLTNSTIRNNLALGSGGGIYLVDGTLEIVDSTIFGNQAPNLQGGGLAIYSSDTTIVRTTIDENEAFAGGGLFHQDGRLHVVESQISGNTAWGGGGMRIARSEVEVMDTSFLGNRATYREGGGIRALQTKITITESLFDGNSARDGGALWSYDGETHIAASTFTRNSSLTHGGAITTNGGALKVQVTAIVDNSSSLYGGGVATASSNAVFLGCIIVGNEAGFGGGILAGGALRLVDSVVRGNSATHTAFGGGGGGGIWCISGEIVIDRSDISDNQAEYTGGGIYIHDGSLVLKQSLVSGNESGYAGGGIFTQFAHISLNNTTVSGNQAGTLGGGIYAGVAGHEASLDSTTISSNTAGEGAGGIYLLDGYLKLSHSIVASNAAPSGPDLERFFVATFVPHHSIVGDAGLVPLGETSNRIPDANGNFIGGPVHGVIDPKLAPLADNGGFELPDGSRILTHALLLGSPATNAGDLNAVAGQGGVPAFDQRGEPFGRIVGGRIDIGAFEYQTPTDLNLLVDTLADESDGDYSRGDLSLREAIELANQNRFAGVTDTIHFDPALTAAGPATILLTRGELKITDSLTINGPGADLLTIDASGNDPTPDSTPLDSNFRDDADGSRIFNIDDSVRENLTSNGIFGLRLTGGDRKYNGGAIYSTENLTLESVLITGNTIVSDIGGNGGGIFIGNDGNNQRPTLMVKDSVVSGNYASTGGGISGRNANIVIAASRVLENHGRRGGGGIDIHSGALDVSKTLLRANTGWTGGAIRTAAANTIVDSSEISDNVAESGGGISASGNLLVKNSKVSENRATLSGGAVAGSMTIVASQISGNTAGGNGGGVYGSGVVESCNLFANTAFQSGGGIYGRDMQILNSALSGNLAYENGGAIAGNRGNLEIVGSTLYGNTSYQSGGGVFRDGAYFYGELTIRSTTIAWNNSRTGGGIFIGGAEYAPSSVKHSTIVHNRGDFGGGAYLAGSNIALQHSILAENQAILGRDLTGLIGSAFELTFSLIGDNGNSGLVEAPIGAPDANGNLIGGTAYGLIDPQLQEVWYGPTPDRPDGLNVFVPAASSPAVDAGDPHAIAGVDGIPEFDQRGSFFDRVVGGRIDIGAVEVQTWGLLPGDYQRDRVIDARDYTAWRDSLGSVASPGIGADGNGDGVVDEQDYAVWKSNFGATVYVQSTLVATPAASFGSASRIALAEETAPAVAALSNLAGSRTLSQRLAPPFEHAPQPPALPGVLTGIDRNPSPTFSPRDRALAAWFASRRPAAMPDSKADVEPAARETRQHVANSFDAALATLDDDRDTARRRALHVLH